MANFDSTKTALGKLLEEIIEGKVQLPDFQRGWVWDDANIQSLLVSIARSFPIGSVMLLENGGSAQFQIRPVEGVTLASGVASFAENLILDGQQRLTSLTQVLKLSAPVKTKDEKKRNVDRFYYINIEKSLGESANLEESIFAVDSNRTVRGQFGKILLDLSSQQREFEEFCFPCNQILNSDDWEEGLMKHDSDKFSRYMEFRKQVLSAFRSYNVPVIQLKKETSKEAVCLVFEKVNTGGVPLSVFELATATYAAEGFNLRDDWFGRDAIRIVGRSQKFALQPLLKDIQSTEFLQGISLLTTYEKRCADIANGVQNIAAVSAKREHVLALTLSEYKRWADRLSDGFFVADRFLRMEGFHDPGYLPYRSQMTPLAAVMAHLGERWMEPVIRDKLTRWYWSGVLGELYSGATETRIANDLVQLLAWINEPNAKEPSAVTAAGFQSSRLDTLRSRTSAAYRGIYILIQRQGSKDFFWKAKMIEIDREECGIDLHHIFPKDWCNKNNISPSIYNSIINKTPISYKANRMIGGSAPSKYLEELRTHTQVKINLSEQDEILKSHLITPELLRSDNFFAFFSARKISMINTIAGVMGKAVSDEIDTTSDGDQEHED